MSGVNLIADQLKPSNGFRWWGWGFVGGEPQGVVNLNIRGGGVLKGAIKG